MISVLLISIIFYTYLANIVFSCNLGFKVVGIYCLSTFYVLTTCSSSDTVT